MPENKPPRRIPEMPKDPYYAFDESWTPPPSYEASPLPAPQRSSGGLPWVRGKMRALPRLLATAILLLWDFLERVPSWVYVLLVFVIACLMLWRFLPGKP
jgi:hypothetical protein